MGKYFMMSIHFNKNSPEDFGLISQKTNVAINPKDDTIWIKTSLYDFGWGKENGYYKLPLPNFIELFQIALHSDCDEDIYGAAAIILDKYPEKLLDKCETITTNRTHLPEFKRLIELFDLKVPRNRCKTLNKTYTQIKNDFERWKRISEFANHT